MGVPLRFLILLGALSAIEPVLIVPLHSTGAAAFAALNQGLGAWTRGDAAGARALQTWGVASIKAGGICTTRGLFAPFSSGRLRQRCRPMLMPCVLRSKYQLEEADDEDDGERDSGWGRSPKRKGRTSPAFKGAAVDADIRRMQDAIANLGQDHSPSTIEDYNNIIKLCAAAARSGAGQLAVTNGIFVLLEIKRVGLEVNERTFGALMDTCAKAAAIDEAHKVGPPDPTNTVRVSKGEFNAAHRNSAW